MTGKPESQGDTSFTVDGIAVVVSDSHQTAASILTLAGLDSSQYSLGKLHGDGQPYRDDQPVHVKNGDSFVSVKKSAQVA